MSISKKPYFVRAIYEWCQDSELTPYLAAYVDERTKVPMQYVRDNEIILNIGAGAVQNLKLDNDWINFSARFSGVSHDIWVPMGNVLSVYARETGEGMGFELEVEEPPVEPVADITESQTDTKETAVLSSDEDKVASSSEQKAAPFLKVIKK